MPSDVRIGVGAIAVARISATISAVPENRTARPVVATAVAAAGGPAHSRAPPRKRSTIISEKPTPSASPVIEASATAIGSVRSTFPEQRHGAEAGERRDRAEAR